MYRPVFKQTLSTCNHFVQKQQYKPNSPPRLTPRQFSSTTSPPSTQPSPSTTPHVDPIAELGKHKSYSREYILLGLGATILGYFLVDSDANGKIRFSPNLKLDDLRNVPAFVDLVLFGKSPDPAKQPPRAEFASQSTIPHNPPPQRILLSDLNSDTPSTSHTATHNSSPPQQPSGGINNGVYVPRSQQNDV